MVSLKAFDFHSKVRDDARITTGTGGAVSVVSCVLLFLLSSSELFTFLTTPPKEILTVDTERSQRLPIFFNVTFSHLACAVISVDTSDVSGEEHQDIVESIYKVPIDHDGVVIGEAEVISNHDAVETPLPNPDDIDEHVVDNVNSAGPRGSLGRKAPNITLSAKGDSGADGCGECYGAAEPGECCNTCEEVREAYRKRGWLFYGGEHITQCHEEVVAEDLEAAHSTGCQIAGQIQVAKVKGKLQFTPSKNNRHVHEMIHSLHGKHVNTSHTINFLRFGSKLRNYQDASPLDGHMSSIEERDTTAAFRYHVNIVPTSYEKSSGSIVRTNQYAVTQEALFMSEGDFHEVPGVFVEYDISPIRVHVIENPRSLITFLTNLAAILGGIFTISGIVDSALFHSSKKR